MDIGLGVLEVSFNKFESNWGQIGAQTPINSRPNSFTSRKVLVQFVQQCQSSLPIPTRSEHGLAGLRVLPRKSYRGPFFEKLVQANVLPAIKMRFDSGRLP